MRKGWEGEIEVAGGDSAVFTFFKLVDYILVSKPFMSSR